MDKILVINFKRHGDIIASSEIIAGLKEKNRNSEITLLVFDEFASSAKIISHVDHLRTIDRKTIQTLWKNKIYSNSFAINKYMDDLSDILDTRWQLVVNYSNCQASSRLASYFYMNGSEIKGTYFNGRNRVTYSNDWAVVMNDILTSSKNSSFHFNDVYRKILNIKKSPSFDLIKSLPKHDATAEQNLNNVREANIKNGRVPRLVGFQLSASTDNKSIPVSILVNAIKETISSDFYYPILLIAPNQNERELVNEINSHFENPLITAEADFLALPSVLKNLNAVITPDTSIKHLCDALGVPALEVSIGDAPMLKQGTRLSSSAILSKDLKFRNFSISESIDFNENDLITGLKWITNECDINNIKLSNGVGLYIPTKCKTGTIYKRVDRADNGKQLFNRLVAHYYLNDLYDNDGADESVLKYIYENNPIEDIEGWIQNEKIHASDITKSLLSAIRAIIQLQEDPKKSDSFITALDNLLEYTERGYVSDNAAIIFRARVDSISSNTMKDSIKELEAALYSMKGNIQRFFECLRRMEEIQKGFRRKEITDRIQKDSSV